MSITLQNPKHIGGTVWEFEWSGGIPPYSVYSYDIYNYIYTNYDGTRIQINGTSSIQPPTIEILDADSLTPEGVTYPAIATVQWRGVASAKEYKIYDIDAAETIDTVKEDGRGYYRFNIGTLWDDATDVNITVNVIDYDGNESAAYANLFVMRRNPAAPEMSITWDQGTSTATIAKA